MALGIIGKEKTRQYYREPLYRNAAILILGTAATSLTGLLFWVVAVRLVPATEIGLAGAATSAAALIVMLSRLGLDIGLTRFLPGAARPSRMYSSVVILTTCAAVAGIVAFVAATGAVSPALATLRQPPAALVFIAYVAATAVAGLQNTALIALRKTGYSLAQNLLLGVRIPLLFVLAPLGMIGIFLASAAAYLAAYPVGRRALKAHGIRLEPRVSATEIKGLAGYSVGNYVCSLLAMAPATVMPLLIVNVIGAEEGAYFYIAYSVASILFMVPAAISLSLFVEGSHEVPLASGAVRSILMSLAVLVPVIAVVLLCGDSLLLLFSREYSAQSAYLLKLLSLASVFNGIITIFIAVKKVEGDLRSICLVTLLLSLATIGSGYLLMQSFGVAGLGYAWLFSNTAVMAFVAVYWRPWTMAR